MIDSILQLIASKLDNPLIPWKRLLLGFHFGTFLFENWLLYRQYGVLSKSIRPKTLHKEIDQTTFDQSQVYGRAKAKFQFVSSVIDIIRKSLDIYYNVSAILWSVAGVGLAQYAPARFSGEISQSLVFFFMNNIIATILELPLSYYHHFVLEESFGFNKMTVRLWITDKLRVQIIAAAFGSPIIAGFLYIIKISGDRFFFWVWCFFLMVQLIAITIYPILIVPFFNKLTPLKEGSLKSAIDALAARLNFPLNELYVIDGSKRSSHSNAYFTGLPWKKQIVLFDTLVEQQSQDEVVAVLAHELGHWHAGHTAKLFGINSAHFFIIFCLLSTLIHNKHLYSEFGFYNEQPIFVGFYLLLELLTPIECLVKFGMNFITRAFEYQADEFALKLGYKLHLAQALIKLQAENLSTMDADPMYSSYHYSHPILAERLRAIGWDGSEKVSKSEAKNSASEKAEKATGVEL